MTPEQLIEAANEKIGTDSEIARRLEITRQAISRFRNGQSVMPDHIAVKLAEMAGLDPAQTLIEINAEKADERTRKVWEEIGRRIGTAAALLLVVGMLGGVVQNTLGNLYIM